MTSGNDVSRAVASVVYIHSLVLIGISVSVCLIAVLNIVRVQ